MVNVSNLHSHIIVSRFRLDVLNVDHHLKYYVGYLALERVLRMMFSRIGNNFFL